MTELRYVITDEINKAVAGRETDVLDALGIDWRAGHPHIRCPYPDHADNDPSWRWDERRAHAICTCVTNGHAGGIFDVVQKVERIGFQEAKIRVAELLQRDDLVRTKSEGRNRQKLDAHSLLNAKAPRRDDRLPIIYLAHRLGISEDEVPRPSIRAIGLKSLAYYDPPAKKDDKPIFVGEWPCAVFGTVAADGRTHAHRIYLAPDGRGKADLGIGPNKKPRNSKKSAKIIGDDNTTGCAVLWGNPNTATHVIICEGIETAAAGATALKAEIDAGTIAVASAINAGGIETFQPYPATRRVTIAADRDDATKDGKPGNRRGETAARAFALKHHKQFEVLIALPGNPGESIDWLDTFRRDGPEAVRTGIAGANVFVPTEEEIGAAATAKTQADELQEINKAYPLPQNLNSLKLEYRYACGRRIMMHYEKANPETNQKEWVPFATPFCLTARLRYADQNNAYGLRCVVQDMSGQRRDLDFDREQLAKMAATDIRAALFRAGLRTEFNGENVVVNILKAVAPEREILAVRQPGWHEITGHPAPFFITPKGTVIAGPTDIELAAAARLTPEVAEAGTLEGWCKAAAAAALVKGVPPLGARNCRRLRRADHLPNGPGYVRRQSLRLEFVRQVDRTATGGVNLVDP